MSRRILVVVVFAVVATQLGCGTDPITPQVTCQTTNMQRLRLEDPSPLGFSPLEVITNAVDTYEASIAWADNMTGTFEVSLEIVDNTTRFEERSFNGEPGPGALPCEDSVVVDMRVVLISEEGRLNDLLNFVGTATTATELNVAFNLPSSLNGDFDIADFAPSGASAPRAVVNFRSSMSGVTGTIDGFADGEAFDIATVTTP